MTARVTHVGGYVETDPTQSLIATHAGGYIETGPPTGARVEHVGAYIETELLPLPPSTPVGVTFDGVDLLIYADKAALEAQILNFDATTVDDEAVHSLPTVTRWAFPFGGHWSHELDGRLGPLAMRGARGPLAVRFDTVTYAWADAELVDYRVTSSAPAAGIVWLATIAGSGKPIRSST